MSEEIQERPAVAAVSDDAQRVAFQQLQRSKIGANGDRRIHDFLKKGLKFVLADQPSTERVDTRERRQIGLQSRIGSAFLKLLPQPLIFCNQFV
jgi:hypothetical protein